MSISCGCDFDREGVLYVGEPKEVTCRTKPLTCAACQKTIAVGEKMFHWARFDYDENRAVPPGYLCEECGEMAENLMGHGFCFSVGDGSLREQWLDYAYDNGIIARHPMHKSEEAKAS